MEKDDEVSGEGNSYNTTFRQYDSRIARWLSLDPLMAKYPHQSPYVAFNNNPIYYADPTGLEGDPPQISQDEVSRLKQKGFRIEIADPSNIGGTFVKDDGYTYTTMGQRSDGNGGVIDYDVRVFMAEVTEGSAPLYIIQYPMVTNEKETVSSAHKSGKSVTSGLKLNNGGYGNAINDGLADLDKQIKLDKEDYKKNGFDTFEVVLFVEHNIINGDDYVQGQVEGVFDPEQKTYDDVIVDDGLVGKTSKANGPLVQMNYLIIASKTITKKKLIYDY
jgi:RHS repeat-associated protein